MRVWRLLFKTQLRLRSVHLRHGGPRSSMMHLICPHPVSLFNDDHTRHENATLNRPSASYTLRMLSLFVISEGTAATAMPRRRVACADWGRRAQ